MAINKWEIQDEVYINGTRIPGRVFLSIDMSRAVKKTKTPGEDIPHLEDEGYDGAVVEMLVELFKEDQWDAMLPIVRMMTPNQPGALAQPLDIVAALTIQENIPNVYVEKRTVSTRRDGFMPFTFTMPQWFPPEKKKKTQQGNTPPKNGTPGGNDDVGGFEVPPPDPNNIGPDFP